MPKKKKHWTQIPSGRLKVKKQNKEMWARRKQKAIPQLVETTTDLVRQHFRPGSLSETFFTEVEAIALDLVVSPRVVVDIFMRIRYGN